MTRAKIGSLLAVLLASSTVLWAVPALAQTDTGTNAAAAGKADVKELPKTLTIGYLHLDADPRFDADYAYAQIPWRMAGDPADAIAMSLEDAATISKVIGVDFVVEKASATSAEELVAASRVLIGKGAHFIIADLPAVELLAVSDSLKGEKALLFNISEADDALRGADCRANMVHIIPSQSMLSDAALQYMTSRNWRNILILQGPADADTKMTDAVKRSASRFGVKIVDVRPFTLTNDPRQREKSNVALVTGNATYDAIFVSDSDGEFARYVPFATQLARPVIGAAGLTPVAWHWSWERNGAPQVDSRFERTAGRRMGSEDWATWLAIKMVVQSVMRSKSTEFDAVRTFMFGERAAFDGSKGNPQSIRSWDNQLRQPILLTTGNAIIERAPLAGFLHQTNELDTLGIDGPETSCTF